MFEALSKAGYCADRYISFTFYYIKTRHAATGEPNNDICLARSDSSYFLFATFPNICSFGYVVDVL